mgnify:CR=1 FL=1
MNSAEQYPELYKYFKGLYFSKKWYTSHNNYKDDPFIRSLFHDVLFSRMPDDMIEESTFDIIIKDFLRDPKKFNKKEEQNSYIAKVFKSRLNDLWQQRKKEPRQFAEEEEQKISDTSVNIDPEQNVIEENLKKISEDIKKTYFTPEIYNLLSLYYQKDLTYAKIAKVTGRSISGIGDAMKRIHCSLGQVIEEKIPIPPWLMDHRKTVLGLLFDLAEIEELKENWREK